MCIGALVNIIVLIYNYYNLIVLHFFQKKHTISLNNHTNKHKIINCLSHLSIISLFIIVIIWDFYIRKLFICCLN